MWPLLAVLTVPLVFGAGDSPNAVAFRRLDIVPNVIPRPPLGNLSAEFQYFGRFVSVQLGNVLKPSLGSEEPAVKWDNAPGKLYTFLIVDPDAQSPNSSSSRGWLYDLVVNIPGNPIRGLPPRFAEGYAAAVYLAPFECAHGTGIHRFVLLTYEQSERITLGPSVGSLAARPVFSVQEFVAKNKLVETPIAGNVFLSKDDGSTYDAWVCGLDSSAKAL